MERVYRAKGVMRDEFVVKQSPGLRTKSPAIWCSIRATGVPLPFPTRAKARVGMENRISEIRFVGARDRKQVLAEAIPVVFRTDRLQELVRHLVPASRQVKR